MTDYSKLKNAELEALLKERSLPHTGKKADMVARLVEADKGGNANTDSTTSKAPAPGPAAAPSTNNKPTANAEDEIDWDDETTTAAAGTVPSTTIEPADSTSSTTKPSKTSISAPETASTTTEKPTDPTSTPAPEAVPKAPTSTFISTLNLPPTDIEVELAKRKARALKFGIVEQPTPAEDDAKRKRAERFGTGAAAAATEMNTTNETSAVKGLDEALPEKRSRKRGRGAEGETDGAGKPAKDGAEPKRQRGGGGAKSGEKKDGAPPTAPATKKGNNSNGNAKPAAAAAVEKKSNGAEKGVVTKPKANGTATAGSSSGAANWMSEADRAAAEKRKAKWATPTTSTSTPAPAASTS